MPPELATYLVLALGLNLVHIKAIDLSMEWRRYGGSSRVLIGCYHASEYWYDGSLGRHFAETPDPDYTLGTYWWPQYKKGSYRQ